MTAEALRRADPVTTLQLDLGRPEPKPVKQFLAGLGVFLVAQVASAFVLAAFAIVALFGDLATDAGAAESISLEMSADADGMQVDGFELGDILALSPAGTAAGLAVGAALSVLGFLLVVPRLSGRRAFELTGPRAWREFGIGLAIGAAPIVLAVGVLALVGSYRVTDVSLNWGILAGVMIGVGAAFAEEVFFRGFMLRLLDKRFGSWVALAGVSLVFGLIHLTNPGATLWGAIAIVLAAGPLLNAAYLLTRRLWLPIGIHLAWNAAQSALFGIDVSGSGSGRGLFESELRGAEWLSGGSMGVEGSIVLVAIGTAFGVGLTVLAHRRGRMLPGRGRREAVPAPSAAESSA